MDYKNDMCEHKAIPVESETEGTEGTEGAEGTESEYLNLDSGVYSDFDSEDEFDSENELDVA